MQCVWHGKQPLAKFASYDLPRLIHLGIAIDLFPTLWHPIFLDEIASSSKPGQHGEDSIQTVLLDSVFVLIQSVAHAQNILNRGTFDGRSAGDLKILSSVRLTGFRVTLSDI